MNCQEVRTEISCLSHHSIASKDLDNTEQISSSPRKIPPYSAEFHVGNAMGSCNCAPTPQYHTCKAPLRFVNSFSLFPQDVGSPKAPLRHCSLHPLLHTDDSVTDAEPRLSPISRTRIHLCLRHLTGALPGKEFFHGSANYTKTRLHDEQEDLPPKCVFVPSNDNGVAKGIIVLRACQSTSAARRRPYAGLLFYCSDAIFRL